MHEYSKKKTHVKMAHLEYAVNVNCVSLSVLLFINQNALSNWETFPTISKIFSITHFCAPPHVALFEFDNAHTQTFRIVNQSKFGLILQNDF